MNYTANYLAGIVIVVVMAKILMFAANYIGERIGIGKFLIGLWQKLAEKYYSKK